MTDINAAREAIYQLFATQWPLAEPSLIRATPYGFENEAIDPVETGWMRLSVVDGLREQETLGPPGARKFEQDATIFLQYFEAPFGGTDRAGLHTKAAKLIFDARRIGGTTIRTMSATTRNLGIVEDGRWFAALMECPIVFDEQV